MCAYIVRIHDDAGSKTTENLPVGLRIEPSNSICAKVDDRFDRCQSPIIVKRLVSFRITRRKIPRNGVQKTKN